MSLTGFQRRRRELAAKKQAQQVDQVESPQKETPEERQKRQRKGGSNDASG